MHPAAGGCRDRPHFRPPLPYPDRFHLLEVTVISAQDLFPAVKSSMQAYAIVRAGPGQKHRTRTDRTGHTSPTWGDKFTFSLDDATLRSDTFGISFDIYAAQSKFWPGRDTLIGTARTLLNTVQPTLSVQLVALQVRRPSSLRPQGILNISVALVQYAKSMPLYAGIGIATRAGKDMKKEEKARIARSLSVREMEMKLKRWRVELPTAKNEDGGLDEIKEAREGAERSAAALMIGKVMSRRTRRGPDRTEDLKG